MNSVVNRCCIVSADRYYPDLDLFDPLGLACRTGEDSVRNESRPTVMTWTMMTRAKVQKVDDQTLRLQEKGKSLYLHVSGVRKATWEIKPATPPTAYENQNKGFTAIHIHAMLNPNEETTMRVLLSSRTEGTRKSEKDGK